jgi:murein L,D-transpeptidase YafK
MIFGTLLISWILKVVFFHTPAQLYPKHRIRRFLTLLLTAALALPILLPFNEVMAAPADDVWLSVDTDKLSLAVMQGNAPLKVFENIAIGSNGPTMVKRRDDATTPLGEFTITEVKRSARFKLFMAINYPNLDHTERAFLEQRIDAREYNALINDLKRGRPPAQNTSLGGQLGIHGVGTGDMKIHESVNWTNGCIALTNDQLLELASWVTVGTRVVVR